MSFLNPALAWGACAAAIPLILHILNRSRFRRVEWGAMHLLESVVKVNHKRFRLEQLILLLLRCAIPALLAFCLAKPVLTGAQGLAGDAPVSLVVLLDRSYSMDAESEAGTRFDEAVEAASTIIEATPRGSEIAVIQTGGATSPLFDQPVFNQKAVVRRLRTAQSGYGAINTDDALSAALTTLSGMTNARKELIVISDFQTADWQSKAATVDIVRSTVDAMDIKPEVTFLPVGQPAEGNVSIESLEYPPRPLGIGHQLNVRANLRNHGTKSIDNARVILKIDGVEESVSQISLAANGATQTLFPCRFDEPGSHVVEVEVIADDGLKTDNRISTAVTVLNQIDVLLVDGDPNTQPLKSETDFLSVALTPFSFGRMKLADIVKTKTITNQKQLNKDSLTATSVVVLANVSRLQDDQVAAVSDYVSGGGALIICAGNKIDTRWYNETLFAKNQLLPAEFGVPRGKISEAGTSARLVSRFEHPALQLFNDASNGDLSTAEIRQWYELKEPKGTADGGATAASATVMVRLNTGEPFLIERQVGDGVVIQMATACDADWSDLPLRPFFVPLVQELITSVATRLTPPRNISTGQPAVALFPREDDDTSELTLSVETPAGIRRPLKSVADGNQSVARFEYTSQPGVYAMTTPAGKDIHFVANTVRTESNLTTLDDKQLKSVATDFNAKVSNSPAVYLEQERQRRHGREIWKYFLIALLVCMFLELLLQQRFSRVRA